MRRAAAALALLLMPAAALADHGFILPSSTLISGEGSMVTFDAAGADHVFFFDHRPLALETIKATRPDGTLAQPMNATRTRFRSVFDLKLDQQGTWSIVSDQTMVTGSFRQGGEERRVGGRGLPPPGATGPGTPGGDRMAMPGSSGEGQRRPPVAVADIPADATDVHLVEIVNRTATFVTAGAPTAPARPTGVGLEFDPITHPNALVAGETARFRFLIDGRPAAGVKVTAILGGERYRDDVGAMNLTTGADGTIAVKWPAAGMYWLGAEAEDAHPAEHRAEKRRMVYAATLEVMTP